MLIVIGTVIVFNPGTYKIEPDVLPVRKSVPPLTYDVVVPPVPKYPPLGILILALNVFNVIFAPDGTRFGKMILALIVFALFVRNPMQSNYAAGFRAFCAD